VSSETTTWNRFATFEPALAAWQESGPPAKFVKTRLEGPGVASLAAADAHAWAGANVNVASNVAVPGVRESGEAEGDEEQAATPQRRRRSERTDTSFRR